MTRSTRDTSVQQNVLESSMVYEHESAALKQCVKLAIPCASKILDKHLEEDKNKGLDTDADFDNELLATLPELRTDDPAVGSLTRETCVWAMDENRSKENVKKFCDITREQLNMPIDEALFHLHNNNFDYQKAAISASNELVNKWSEEDRLAFHFLFKKFGREHFHKIQRFMSHKSLASITDYYYRVKLRYGYSSKPKPKEEEDSERGKRLKERSRKRGHS